MRAALNDAQDCNTWPQLLSHLRLANDDVVFRGPVKVAVVMRALGQDGWTVVRTRGSHRQLKHPVKRGLVTVAGKPSSELPPGTLARIRKQAQLEDLR